MVLLFEIFQTIVPLLESTDINKSHHLLTIVYRCYHHANQEEAIGQTQESP